MKRLFVVMVMLMTALCVYGQTLDQQNRQDQMNASISLFKQAQDAYEAQDAATARRLFRQIVNMSAAPLELRDKAASMLDLLGEAKPAVQVAEAPEVTCTDGMTAIAPEGDFREMTISSKTAWKITSMPSWVSIEEQTRNYLKIWCAENNTKAYRSGTIVFSASGMDKVVNIEQKPGVEKRGRVFFKTTPHNAFLSASDGSANFSSSPLVFGVGEYVVSVSKDGYQSKDTTIVVTEVMDTTRVVEVELEPLFGKLVPVVLAEDGNIIPDAEIRIGTHRIEMSDIANSHSFDDRTDIGYYNLYKEGAIPLSPGEYDVDINADGYSSVRKHVVIERGKTATMDVTMEFIMSRLLVKNESNADGAAVYIPELDVTGKVGEVMTVPVGKYQVEVRKDGYMLDVGVLNAEVKMGETTELEASMTRMVDMYISTDVGGERVVINGEIMNYQKPEHHFSLIEGEKYSVEVTKNGYWHYEKEFTVTSKDKVFDFRNIEMVKVDTLVLDSDVPNLLIKLTRKGDDSGKDYAEGARTPGLNFNKTELLIPYGKYRIVLEDENESKRTRRTVYRGRLNFTEKTGRKYYSAWMKSGVSTMRFLSFEGTLLPSYASATPDYMPVPLKTHFLDFSLFRGLSTTLLAEGAMIYTAGMEMPENLQEGRFNTVMPAVSPLFTNYDFRIGGGIFQYADISAVVSYSYYLDFDGIAQGFSDKFIKKEENKYGGYLDLDYFTGHDVFAGVELGTRLKYFNVYVRAGLQYYKGERYYYCNNSRYDSTDTWITDITDVRMPVNQTSFVVTLGFNLGSRDAKGQNILRVF